MNDCDVVVAGGGHNALVCAGYLAKAGVKVLVVERRHRIGGAVVTEEIIPGFQFDLGGSAHILINHTPIVADLALEQHGLEYLDLDPLFFSPYLDGSSLTIYRDVERTCESIARISPRDADAYRRFIAYWKPVAEDVVATFNAPPTAGSLMRHLVAKRAYPGHDRWEDIRAILGTYAQFVEKHFTSSQVRALVGWMAAQSGPPPNEPISAPFALWHPMYHVSGIKRPRGGSGMLTQALARMIEAHGGRVITGQPVTEFIVRQGRVRGVVTAGGERYLARRAVVSGMHIHTTFRLLGDQAPQRARRLIDQARVGNGFGFVARYAVSELPNYLCQPTPGGGVSEAHIGLQLICPSLDHVNAAYGDYLAGRPSREPCLVVMTFSAVDDSLAPPGKHVLFIWGQYYPYQLAGGQQWADIAEREADRLLDTLSAYAPNVRSSVIGRFIETPEYLERELGILKGNVMHLEMSIDQMFMLRPALSMSQYRGPVKGLYLTGASTHPGGGIMGSAGRNAAQVLLRDLKKL
jgi:phytoene dehydrogenase-like protein